MSRLGEQIILVYDYLIKDSIMGKNINKAQKVVKSLVVHQGI